jgi:microcystin-dependent protein
MEKIRMALLLVALSMLSSGAMSGQQVPVGSVVAFAGPTASIPAGWLVCDGRKLDRNADVALFNAVGTTWGGDGAPDFYLPDLRGAFLRGVDKDQAGQATNPANDPDRDSRTAPRAPSPSAGNQQNNVGSLQLSATRLPNNPFSTNMAGNHVHSGTLGDRAGTHPNGGPTPNPDGTAAMGAAGDHSHVVIAGGDAETRPRNAYVYFIIRVR